MYTQLAGARLVLVDDIADDRGIVAAMILTPAGPDWELDIHMRSDLRPDRAERLAADLADRVKGLLTADPDRDDLWQRRPDGGLQVLIRAVQVPSPR